MSASTKPKRLCIIGAGMSGLSVLIRLRQKGLLVEDLEINSSSKLSEKIDVVCYDRHRQFGGLWNYNWRTGN